ncbi:hypothetical protein PYW07_011857 [Mythimna separata]|uniref:DUF4802 domain-containing protein n=1 Tax=Mythimna separata TaxID=271217 RepID=A0AAD7Y788_MYTSE|nr:hypothetical protein PYW07_011857 [Mythimna separata]
MLRSRRRQSTTALCEPEDMKPALLNNVGNSGPTKCAKGRGTLLALLWSLTRRKRRGAHDEIYLRHIDNALQNTCTYRESCRCLECQSRYFECDEDSEDYSSDEDSYVPRYVVEAMEAQHQIQAEETDDEDDDETTVLMRTATSLATWWKPWRHSIRSRLKRPMMRMMTSVDYSSDEDSYVPRYVVEAMEAQHQIQAEETDDEDDDEVFIDTVPGDNTSTDMLIDKKMSVSSDEATTTEQDAEDKLQLEVAAGTPVLLNYLLTHPITCSIQ